MRPNRHSDFYRTFVPTVVSAASRSDTLLVGFVSLCSFAFPVKELVGGLDAFSLPGCPVGIFPTFVDH